MSDNQSFLRLIGFEEEPTPEQKTSDIHEESFTHEFASDFQEEVQAEFGSQPEFEAQSEYSEEPIEKTERMEEEIVSDSENIEVTEREVTEAEPTVETTDGEGTQLYTADEIQSISPFPKENTVREYTRTIRTNTKSIRAVAEKTRAEKTRAEATAADQTRGTVPLVESIDEEDNRTAHFDYDQEQGIARIVVLDGKTNSKAFYLNQLPLKIGRDPQNDIILDDHNSSRFHAEIQDDQGIQKVVDLGSTNGLKVNGKIVIDHVLQSHDVIQIGDCLLEYLTAGELSKGLPQAQVMAETASVQSATPKKKKIVVLGSIIVMALAAIFLFNFSSGSISKKANQVVLKQAEDELLNLRNDLSARYQKPIEEIPAPEMKKVLVDKIQSSSLGSLIPESIRGQIDQLPPEIVKIFMLDQALVAKVMASGGNPQALDIILRGKLNDLIVQKQYPLALGLAKALLQTDPTSQTLKDAVAHLEDMVKLPPVQGDEEKKYYEYIEKFDKNYQDLVSARKFDEALAFCNLVREKLLELIKMESFFEVPGGKEVKKWEGRIETLKKQIEDAETASQRRNDDHKKEEERFHNLKALWDLGDFGRLLKESDRFLKDFPDSSHADEVASIRKEIEGNLSKAFEKTKSDIEQQIQTESYESAWKTLYLFLDNLPEYKPAESLKAKLEGLTRARAVQYYNQARVYEYEADDLIAAEQHYRKSMEMADPRSDLHKKSFRRFEDVRRKNMK